MSKSIVVSALNPAQEFEAAKAALYASTEGLSVVQQGQNDSVRRAGLAFGAVHPSLPLYKGNQKGKNQCEGWAGIDAARLEMKARIVEIRTKAGYTEAQATAFFDSTFNQMKDYFAKSIAPKSSEVVPADEATKTETKSQRSKVEMMVDAVLDARVRLDKVIADKEATDKQVKAAKYLRIAALLVEGKSIPADLIISGQEGLSSVNL